MVLDGVDLTTGWGRGFRSYMTSKPRARGEGVLPSNPQPGIGLFTKIMVFKFANISNE